MTISSTLDIANAHLIGKTRYSTWRKSPTQVTTQGIWFDLSMSPGNPNPQYYAASPLVPAALAYSTDGGLFHGRDVAPDCKILRTSMVMTATATALPMPMMLLDYLLFYPFIEEGTTDAQAMLAGSSLPRYTDGAGVQMMAVSVAGRTGGQSFTVSYTNSDGVAGRTSQAVVQNTAGAIGSVVTSATATNGAAGPFIPLQRGDSGVRSIQSVTMLGTDVGLFTLVLVKPIMQTQIRSIDAPVEVDCFLHKAILPAIADDAYLNFICLPNGSLSGTAIHGSIETIWG